MPYLKEIGMDGVWLSPIFESPMKDFGYDISNYTNIQPEYGTVDDVENLAKVCHQLGIKLILGKKIFKTRLRISKFNFKIRRFHPLNLAYFPKIFKNPQILCQTTRATCILGSLNQRTATRTTRISTFGTRANSTMRLKKWTRPAIGIACSVLELGNGLKNAKNITSISALLSNRI
jgi:hypothetical protein